MGYMANTDHAGYKKIQCWIPQEIWDKIEAQGYPNQTSAVTEAFKSLLDKSQDNPNISQDNPNISQEIPGLRAQLEEKERHIETLKADIDKAEKDKEDLKNTYNNYFLQVQTLINQKAIEAPGAKKPWWRFW